MVKRGIALTGIVFLSHCGHVDFFWAGSSYSKSSSSGLLMKDKRELEQKEPIFTSKSSELMHSSWLLSGLRTELIRAMELLRSIHNM